MATQIYSTPMMFPMDVDGKVYVLQDANGNIIGSGNRSSCERLLKIVTKASASPAADQPCNEWDTPGLARG
jgi:acylphosphatase